LAFNIKYSEKATKQFGAVAKANKKDALRILDKIESYAENPDGRFDIKKLKGKHGTLLRLRIGDYRIIFETIKDTIFVYEIFQRQEGYL
jgi:mRNA-degrading endonuclease RelE of RelBE toxin-antitoxin system